MSNKDLVCLKSIMDILRNVIICDC